jgi:cytidylate kinase
MISKIYPKNIGKYLNKEKYLYTVRENKIKLPKNTIIRVYGLSGVGKGRLCQNLSNALNIPNIDTGKVFRSVCYGYTKLKLLEVNFQNTELVFNNLKFQLSNNQLQAFFKNKELSKLDLKNAEIDEVITLYSKNPILRQQTYNIILDIITNKVSTACLTDARGASEDYVDKAEKLGYKIIRILVDVDFETKLARYYEEIKELEEGKLGRTLRASEREKMYKHLWQVMKQRDEKDLAISQSGQWQLISPDSAIIDTGEYNIQETFQIVLGYIASVATA